MLRIKTGAKESVFSWQPRILAWLSGGRLRLRRAKVKRIHATRKATYHIVATGLRAEDDTINHAILGT
jgi:hypothetical protein